MELQVEDGRNPDDIHIGAVIQALREKTGLSRAELGRAIGRSDKLIQKIETGQRRAIPEVRVAIAETLRVPLAAIIVRDWEQIRDPEPERVLDPSCAVLA
jgi:transcriptional regulator with XRE-family HTH domain